jgi:hypothetical protein
VTQTPSQTTRPASRREGNGRLAALDEIIDNVFDLYARALDTQRQIAKSMLDVFAPMYSVVEEAQRLVRER